MTSPSAKHAPCALVLVLATAMTTGCAHEAGAIGAEVARQATPTAIETSLRALDEEENQRVLAHILESPQIELATERLVARVTDGTLAALTDQERSVRVAQFAHAFAGEIGAEMGEQLRVNVGPEVVAMVGRAVDVSLARALREDNQTRIGEAVANIARESASAVALAFMQEMRPQLRAMLREDLIPAMRDGLRDPEMQRALGETTRTMTSQVVLGMQDAFEQLDARHAQRQGRDTILTQLQGLAKGGSMLARWFAIGLGAVSILLIVWLLRTRSRASALTTESDRREAAIVMLAQAIKATEEKPWAHELRSILKDTFRDNEHADYLRDVLRRQKDLRLSNEDTPGDARRPMVSRPSHS